MRFFLTSFFITLSFLAGLLVYRPVCGNPPLVSGLAIERDAEHPAPDALTLITPFAHPDYWVPKHTSFSSYLVDGQGNVVHRWTYELQPFHAELTPAGTLLVAQQQKPKEMGPAGRMTGQLREYDFNGKQIWEYQDPLMHHDFTIRSDGSRAIFVVEAVSATEIAEDYSEALPLETYWFDTIVELDEKGETRWRWRAKEHVRIKDLSDDDVTHGNSIVFVEQNPIDGTPAYLVSLRNLDQVAFIRRSDGKLLWESPEGMLHRQHDATLTKNNTVLVFDNRVETHVSRVVEIDPRTNDVVWQFRGGLGYHMKHQMFSKLVSGAQELRNGNILVTNGAMGHIFELTKDKRVVWELFNNFGPRASIVAWPFHGLFKARRYELDEVQWPAGRAPTASLLTHFCQIS